PLSRDAGRRVRLDDRDPRRAPGAGGLRDRALPQPLQLGVRIGQVGEKLPDATQAGGFAVDTKRLPLVEIGPQEAVLAFEAVDDFLTHGCSAVSPVFSSRT